MEANLLYKTYKQSRIFLLLMILFAFGGNAWTQNYALRFDGSGDYVNTSFTGTHSIWTLEAWVKDDGTQSDYCSIIQTNTGNDDALYIYPNSSGNVLGYWPASGGTTTVSPNMWTHVAATRGTDGVVRYFVNGLPAGSSGTAVSAINKIQLGGYGTSDPEVFSGIIDEVRIWNYARTTEDIGAWKNIVLTGNESGLLAYWNFNSQNLTDLSANGFNGTIFGNTTIVNSDAPVYANAPGNEAFESVPPTGLPYNIVLSDLTINGSEIPAGTQIGVFDGELCVGTAIYNGSPNQNLVAWKADPSQNLAGFTAGNPMSFKYHIAWHSTIRNFDATKTMLKGNGTFGNGAFSRVNLSVTTSLVPDFAMLDEILNFNTVIVNQSKTLPIVFENNGTAVLAISSIQNSSANFTRSENNFWIAPGSKDTLWITFKPTAVTTYSDQLTFNTDDPDFPNMSVPLYGTGLPQPTAQIVVTPAALNFGGISKNTTKTMLLNILNPGNGTLTVTSISSSNPAFTIFGGGSFSLGQGENRDVSVVFSPTQAGVFNGQLSIINNAQNQSIPLSGIASQGHFTSVAPTGKPYTLIVQDVDIDGFRPLAGDEIAVFDDNLCVGTGISGQGGNSLLLTGSNGYIINDNSTAFDLQQFTISAWVYSSNFNQNGFIFEKGQVNSQYSLFFESGSINFRTIPTEGGYDDFYVNLATAGIVNNQWNHITVTYNGFQKTLFVNGVVKATQSYSKQIRTGMAGQIIGAYGGNGGHSYFYNGNIDEVRVYNYARSVFEIESDRFHELQGNESGLVGYWDFNEGNFNNHVPGSTSSYIGGNASLLGVQNSQIFSNLLITAWEKDAALGLPGFTQGNPMTFKVWTEVYDNWVEVAAIPDYVVGNGNFGFGQLSVLSLEGTSGLEPDISVAIESLYVGQVTVGASVVNTIQVANQGNAPLHFTLSDNSTAFITSISTGIVPANSTLDFQVTFSPASPGGYSGILTIQSNDPDEPAINIGLEGFALPAGASNIGTSLNLLSFGSVVVNSTETLSLIVINTGTTPLTVSSITFNNAAFSATPTSFILQNTNDLKEVLVTFQPGSKGSFSGIMSINSNAAQKQVSLAGTGFEDHFNVVDPTGLPYNIIVQETNLDGYINPGDELSVFDGDLCVGMVTSFTSMNLKSAKFSGSSSYLQVPNSASLNPTAITVEAWVKTTDAGASRTIVSKTAGCASSGYLIWLNENGIGAGRPGFFIGDGPWLDADIAVNDGQWHHVAGTYDGTTARIFVDGVLRNSRTSSENLSSSSPLQIGGSTNCGAYLNGNLDEVKIWNYALSAQQIGQSMNSSLIGNEAGLAGYWSFEDSFGDKSLNNHSTQVVGTTVLEQSAPLLINNQNLNITAWQKDVINGLPGFTTGNPMSFKLWTEINGFATEFTATPTYVVGNGNFGFGQFSVVNLEFALPEVAVDPMELFVALEEPDSSNFTFLVSNGGNAVLNLNATFAASWGQLINPPGQIAPNTSAGFELKVNSSGLIDGLYSSVLTFTTNDPLRAVVEIPVSMNVTGNPQIAALPPSVGFGQVVVNTSATNNLGLQNIGTKDLIIQNIEVLQGISSGFTFTLDGQAFPITISPGESVGLTVTFSPLTPGQVVDTLMVYSNAGNAANFPVRLTAEGITPPEIFIPQTTFVSTMPCNDASNNSLKIFNNGQNNLSVTLVSDKSWLVASPSQATVAGGDSIAVAIAVSSLDLYAGLHEATLSVHSNDPGQPVVEVHYSVTITGEPAILCNDFLNIGTAFVGDTLVGQLTVANSGCDVLEVLSVGAQSQFQVFFINNPNFSVPPGEAAILEIAFVPAATQQYSGIITITSNDPASTTLPVVVSANGVEPPNMTVTPLAIAATVPAGSTSQKNFLVKNTGGQVLQFNTSVNPVNPYMLRLDGNGDYINVVHADLLNPSSAITLEAWIFLNDNTNEFIIGKENSTEGKYRFFVNNNHRFEFSLNNTHTVVSNAVAVKNLWYHVAATFDGTSMRIFINGLIDVEETFSPFTIQSNTDNLRIGRSYQFAYFNGSIDEIRIWDIARNQSEIQSAMNQSLLGTEPELLLYFPFENATGNIVTDASANSNNGILYGNPVRQSATVPFTDYLTVSNGSGSLTANQQQNVNLSLNPGGFFARSYERLIAVNSNAVANPSETVSLSLTITGEGNIVPNPAQVQFANTFIGLRDTVELILQNTGATAVNITDINFSSPVFYSLNQEHKIFPYSSKKLILIFEPGLAQSYSGMLTISSGGAKALPVQIPLSGLGVTPPIPVLSPVAANFGPVVVNHSESISINLSNAGNSALEVYSFSFSDAAFFTTNLQLPVNIAFGQQVQFNISFAPLNYNVISEQMFLNTNIGLLSIPLSGTGVPPDHDLSVSGVLTPENDCGLSASEILKISVKNFGVLPQSNFNVGFSVNNGPVVVETISASLASGNTLIYTFNQALNLAVVGNYNLEVFTLLGNDQNTWNDTLNKVITNYPSVGNVSGLIPADSTFGVVEPVSFSWLPAANATFYDLYLWRTNQPKPASPTVSGITTTHYTYTDYLNKNYLYNWQIIARNQCSESESAIQLFAFNVFSDLIVSEITAPANANSGEFIDISFKISNIGTGGTGIIPWKDDIYISLSPTFDVSTAVKVATVNNLTALNQGQHYLKTVNIKLSDYLEGEFYVFVKTDANNIIQETDENNNFLRSETTMAVGLPPYPDLTVSNIQSLNGNIVPGQTLTVGWSIDNIGDTVATGGWSQRVAIVAGTQIQILGYFQSSETLAASGSVSLSSSFAIPQQLSFDGDVFLQVKITPNPGLVEKPNGDANNTVLSDANVLVEKRLTVFIPQPTLPENAASLYNCMIYRSGNPAQPMVVNLSVSLENRITIPATVTIPANQSGAPFALSAIDNTVIEGNINLVITATANGFPNSTANLTIIDNEVPSLQISLNKTEASEGETFQLTVTREIVTGTSLTVSLFTLKPNQITLPANILIPANTASATIDVAVIDNNTPELTETVVINASLSGFTPGSAGISILDNDLPQIALIINPSSVSESGGPYASWGTVQLSEPANGNVSIMISASADNQVFFPAQVVIPNGQIEKQFNLGVVDNGILDGDRIVAITAAVYISSCGCGAPPETGGAVSQNLTILDNDGPSLSVSANPIAVPESLTNAGMLTITRNTLGGPAITIAIQHFSPDEIVIPATAVIPEGATSVNVPFNTLDDGIEDGDQIVPITVSSLDYSSGSCWVIVSDRNIPDYVARGLALSQNSVIIYDPVQISLKIANVGFSIASDGAEVKIYRSDDNAISTNDVLISTQNTPTVLNVGDSLEISFTYTPSDKIGNFFIIANVNANGAKNELLTINNTTQALPFSIMPDYTATASVSGDVFNGTIPITITGTTLAAAKSPAPNKSVDVYVVVNGVKRIINTVSDGNGEFTVNFVPLNGEAGEYFVGACYPGQNLNDIQDEFTILGARNTATGYILWDLWLGETKSFFLEIQNFSDLDLTNMQLEVLSGPPGCHVNFIPIAQLPGNSLATMSYSINASQITAGTQYEEVKLQLTSGEGTKFKFSAWFFARATKGNLKLNPVVLTKAMVRGITNYAEFEVRNNGNDATGTISILLPENNWMSLASVAPIPSLLPGEAAIVTLRLTPGDDLQLNNPITGQIALSGTNSNSVALPFSFEPVSLETGDFLVDVVDEYTYNTEAAPHLAGATVVISHPYTGQIVTQGITDVNGHFLADDINEGYYNLKVTAPQHGNFQELIFVEKGVTTTKVVFIAFQAITYSWQVVPTMIEDEYEITLVAVFETNVPAPVVEMTMPDTIPQLNYGEVFPFILILTNHGLITAQDVEVTFPVDDEYEFIANVNTIDIMPQTSVQIPVIVQRRPPQSSPKSSTNCVDFVLASYKFECGPDDQMRLVQDDVYYQGRICGGSGGFGGGWGGGWGWCYGCGGGGPGGPGGGYTGPVFPIQIPTAPYTQSNTGCDPCLAEALNCAWECINPIPPVIGCGLDIYANGITWSTGFSCALGLADTFTGGSFGCAWCIGTTIGCTINSALSSPASGGGTRNLTESEQVFQDMAMLDKGFVAIENYSKEIAGNDELFSKDFFGVFNDSVSGFLDNVIPFDQETQDRLVNSFEDTDITTTEIQNFIIHWNTTLEARENGIYSPTAEYPEIIDTLLLHNYRLTLDTVIQFVHGRGFPSMDSLYNFDVKIVKALLEQKRSSVCATVTVQFSQQLTMTREAFEGTLTIFNGHETEAMQNIRLDLEIRDEDGNLRNDLFQINTKALNQITGIDGSGALNSQTEGTAVILFIPERGAAPDVPRYYSFGGTLSYLDPFTGEIFEQTLFPVTLQVNPSPNLFIDYFMQRDILGDDALTEPIEPMIPAELAVMIDNQGAGTAFSVNIESAQPEIIENEKGLEIDFEIVGSNLGGKPTQLGLLDVDFGDIEGGKIGVGQWWFTSTLLGHFISYEVKVNHLSSFGNPDLSLVSDVQIHELIKSVLVYGPLNDSINDFLVNDMPDAEDIPDALYYSTGIVAPVVLADDAQTDGAVNVNDLEVELTVTPSATGWNYAKINDPGNGLFRIVSCIREDGQEIPINNIWLTYVTIPDGGEPNYENKLHFLDTFGDLSPKSYTVVFEAIDQNIPAVVSITGLPAGGITDTPVTNLQVLFNKPIDPASFDYQDMTLKNQGGPNLMDPSVTVTQLTDTTFNVDISVKTSANGFYVLTVQAAGITDLIGNHGQNGKQVSWIQAISTPAIDYFFGLPETPGEPIDTLLVLFNMPINVSTFTKEQLVLTDGADNPIPTSSLVITPESFNNVLFKISGLLPLTSGDGNYKLTVKVTEIQGETGLAGLLDQTVEWTVCQIPLPIADAGDDDSTCIGESYQLNGMVQNQSSFIWTTSGSGTFDNNQIIAPVYTPGQEDILAGKVTISLTAEPLNSCAAAATSSLTITIKNAVEANAGDDATICQNTKHQLFGTISNASSGSWISAGDGSFSNSSILTPVYNPGAQDIANGYALLSLVAEPQSPCVIPDTSNMVLTIQKLPTAYAGVNQTVCEDTQVQLQGVAQNYSSIYWFGGADGIMDDRTIPNPVYNFSEADIERGYVSFLLTAQAANPCFTRAFSTVRINVKKAPVVNAGANTTICENQVLQLNGSVQNHSSYIWQTAGDGTFSNPNILNPVYVPGAADKQNASVQLSLTAQPLNPCQNAVTALMSFSILKLPLAAAGSDATICENGTHQLSGTAQNQSSVLWTTSGNGTFGSASSLTPVYTPGTTDITSGAVTLTLTVSAVSPCLVSASDTKILQIQKLPTVNAGQDGTICHNGVYPVTGNVTFAQSTLWTTSGDGTFSSAGSLTTVYTPGETDMLTGNALLTLTAQPLGPCSVSTSDGLNLVINYCHDLVIPSGWSGISTFVEPVDAALETIFGDVINDLTILYSQTGVFWPGQNLNTIGEWNRLEGYTVKVTSQIDLRIAGSRSSSRTLQLSQGWNLIPVLSECEADVVSLFAGTGVVVVKEVAGWKLYWPALNINTLGSLQSGKAYYVLMSQPATITFGDCPPGALAPGKSSTDFGILEMINAAPWKIAAPTASSHIIGIPEEVINSSLIKTGDYLGAFDESGQCYGLVRWEGESTTLTAFSDDPTTSVKDGFTAAETIYIRLFVETTSQEYDLEISWDEAWPQNDGTFNPTGLSAISAFKLGATQIYEQGAFEVLIYPNPANSVLFIDFNTTSEISVSLNDVNGREVLRQTLSGLRNQLDISALRSGVYFMKLEGDGFMKIEKIIKR